MADERPEPATAPLRERTAEEIRVILARKRMSGSELARRTGMKQPYLSRRLVGEVALDLDDLEVIARELGVTVPELLGSEESSPDTTRRNDPVHPTSDQANDHPTLPHPNGRAIVTGLDPTLRRAGRVSASQAA